MSSLKPVQVIAVTGGKGGVGKTTLSLNLAISLAKQGQKVLVFDADLGLANIDVLLGLKPKGTIADVIDGHCSMNDILMSGPENIQILPAASGVNSVINLSPAGYMGIVQAFSQIQSPIDTLIIDTATGISHDVTQFVAAANEVLVTVCNEPASITDAYALIKILHKQHGVRKFRILANQVASQSEGERLFNQLERVANQYLPVVLDYVGSVPSDEYVKKSIRSQSATLVSYPSCPASRAIERVATRLAKLPKPKVASGQIEFFLERLFHASATDDVAIC